jgi:Flp pilus assembly protein protease CpaA
VEDYYLITAPLVIAWSAVCAAWDLRTGRVPNWLSLPPLALGLACQFLIRGRVHVVEYLVCAGLLIAGWAASAFGESFKIYGGGDLKYLLSLFAFYPDLIFLVLLMLAHLPIYLVARRRQGTGNPAVAWVPVYAALWLAYSGLMLPLI